MEMKISSLCAGNLACFAIAGVLTAGTVIAQTNVKEIIVEAPRAVTAHLDQFNPPGGAKAQTTTIRFRILYSDLDLGRTADAAALESRIESAARSACLQLDKLYPTQPDETCFAKTVAGTRAQVEGAIAAARR